MSETKHIVNSIAVNTSGIATENAFQWRSKLASYISDVFPRQLQLMLDELYCPDEQISIDRLEVNIDLARADTTEQFQRELMQALRRAITDQKQETIVAKLQDTAIPVPFDRSLDAWFFYLKKGYYPWFHQQVIGESELERLIEEHAKVVAGRLPDVLNSLEAQQRLLIQITETTLRLLLPFFVRTKTPDSFFEQCLSIGQSREQQVVKARQLLVRAIVNKQQINERQFIDMIGSTIDPVQQQHMENRPETTHPVYTQKEQPPNPEEEKSSAIWIQNAGLILLHPFLPVLFNRLLVANEQKQIVDIRKALGLIHYLLYAEDEYSDALMILPKILCGLPYNNPVPVEPAINSNERKECDELLLSVIKYWEALKSTSIKGLLEAFVLRKGKLTARDEGWLLRVENRTEDILLDRLPWSIGYIKLPWMTSPLTTEWR